MQITVNGKLEEIPEDITILDLLKRKQISSAHVVVEYNRAIAKSETWPSTMLLVGDSLEILEFVGGG